MNRILTNIRSVSGVFGVIVIDKKRALTYQLLPANYETEAVKNIAIPVLNLGRLCNERFIVDFFFENGRGRFYNQSEAVVLVLGRPEMNFDMLNAVCREAVPAICRKFVRGELADHSADKNEDFDASFELLLKAINILASHAQEKVGAYLVAKHLRNAKDKLVEKHRFLSTLSVDNNGVVSLIKGYPSHKGEDLMPGFAHWANLFVCGCAASTKKLNPADILELTLEIKDKLDLAGFYQVYADIGI